MSPSRPSSASTRLGQLATGTSRTRRTVGTSGLKKGRLGVGLVYEDDCREYERRKWSNDFRRSRSKSKCIILRCQSKTHTYCVPLDIPYVKNECEVRIFFLSDSPHMSLPISPSLQHKYYDNCNAVPYEKCYGLPTETCYKEPV